MLLRWAGAVGVAVLLLGGCTSRQSLPSGLRSRSYVTHLPWKPGTTTVMAKLVATQGAPGDPTGLHLCHWPDACTEPYTFVWLREQLGSYPDESPLGGGPRMHWVLDSVDPWSGRIIRSGGVMGPEPGGSSQFNHAQDLSAT